MAKIISIELETTSGVSYIVFRMASGTTTADLNKEVARSSAIGISKWYWVYAARSISGGLNQQYVALFDASSDNWMVDSNHQATPTQTGDFLNAELTTYVSGYRGYAKGICGTVQMITWDFDVYYNSVNEAFGILSSIPYCKCFW